MVFSFSIARSQSILSRFSITEESGMITLFWQIEGGKSCNGITIQHSLDSINFSQIGSIEGVCGGSSAPTNYNFKHNNPAKNKINYYRLLLGNINPSQTIFKLVIDIKNGYLIQQNPVSEIANIFFENDKSSLLEILIYNINGQLIFNSQTKENMFQINTSNFINGQYLFVLNSIKDNTHFQGKFIVLH